VPVAIAAGPILTFLYGIQKAAVEQASRATTAASGTELPIRDVSEYWG